MTRCAGLIVDVDNGEYVAEIVVRVVVSPHTMAGRDKELQAVTLAVGSLLSDLANGKVGVPGEPGAVYTERYEVLPARSAT